MALDDLSIRISAETADFIAGAEGVESQLGDLSSEAIQTAGALEILSNRADDAGDNISQAGRRATVTSGQFSALAGATNATNTSFLGLSATTWGSLIPAVVALGAALAPVIGALGGFVAVAGSIIGVGLLPTIAAIATNTQFLKTEFMDLLSTLQSAFAPVINEATFILHEFIIAFEEIIPQLAGAIDSLPTLAFAFQELGLTIINALPAFAKLAVTLTQEFLPPFNEFLENILPELPGMIQGLVDTLSRMIPRFLEAGSILMEIIPPFTEFGFTVLNVLGPALARFFEVGTQALEFLNGLSPAVQKSVAALSLLAPVVAVVGKLFGGVILSGLGTVAGILLGPFAAGLSTVVGVLPTVVGSLVAIGGVTANVIGAILPFTGVITGLIGVITSLGGILTSILGPIAGVAAVLGPVGLLGAAIAGAIGLIVMFEDEIRAVAGQILPIMSNAVNSALNWVINNGPGIARSAMNALGRVIRLGALEIAALFDPNKQSVILGAIRDMGRWLIANGPGLLEKAWGALVDVSLAAWEGFKQGLIGNSIIPETFSDIVDYLFNTAVPLLTTAFAAIGSVILAPIESALNRVFNLVGSGVNRLISIINNILSTLPPAVTSQLGFEQIEPIDFQRRETDVQDIAQRRQREIRVVLDERTDIVEGRIENGAQTVVNEESRRARRNSGATGNVR